MTFEESLRPFPYGKGSFFEEFSECRHQILRKSFIKRNQANLNYLYYLVLLFGLLSLRNPLYSVRLTIWEVVILVY